MDSLPKSKPGRPRNKLPLPTSADLQPHDSRDGTRPMRRTRASNLTCQVCGKIFHSVAARSRHDLIHTGERPYACGLCGEQFKRADDLHKHEAKHERGDNYCCYICKMQVEKQEDLVSHMKTHSIDIVPHVSSAGYTFRSSAVVKTYCDLYQSGKPQPCYVCFKEYASPEELLNHLASHTALELIKGSTDRTLWKTSVSYAEVEYSKWRKRRVRSVTQTKPRKDKSGKEHDVSEFTHVCRVCHQMFKGMQMLLDHWLQKKGRRGHEGRVGSEGYDTHIFLVSMDTGKPSLTCQSCEISLNSTAEAAEHFESDHKESEFEDPAAKRPKTEESEGSNETADEHCEGHEKKTENQADKTTIGEKSVGDPETTEDDSEDADLSTGQEESRHYELMNQKWDESDMEMDLSPSGKAICPVCNKTLNNSKLLRHHLSVHIGQRAFLCPVCGKLYSRPEDLKQHIIRHVSQMYRQGNATDQNLEFKCDLCAEAFQSEKDLQFHGVFHGVFRPGTKKYVEGQSTMCPVCGKMLQKATSLVTHIRLHEQKKEFKCNVCGIAFRSERNKERHEKIHTGVKEYKCEVCGKGLSRKAEYVAHVKRHETDPTFNGKAGRKRGTKVINSKVVYVKDIYKPQDNKNLKPKSRSSRKQQRFIQLEGSEQMFLSIDGDTENMTSNQRQTLVCYPEKTIIPYKKKKKMQYEVVMIDDTRGSLLSPESQASQSVETQTDALTPEQSLAHNIEIIDSELRECTDDESLVVGQDLEPAGEATAATAEDDAIIIIVQDPTTGENEVLTIKSFQEGASKLISPNEELMKALESFQKNQNTEEVVTLPTDCDEGTEDVKVKTEIVQSTDDVVAAMETSQSTTAVTETSVTPSAILDQFIKQEDSQAGGSLDDTSKTGDTATCTDPQTPSKIPGNKQVKVVSFTLDEMTGVLVPVYPNDVLQSPTLSHSVIESPTLSHSVIQSPTLSHSVIQSPTLTHSVTASASVRDVADAPAVTQTATEDASTDPVSILFDVDGDMTAVEALMQMKSPEHHQYQPPTNISGSGDHRAIIMRSQTGSLAGSGDNGAIIMPSQTGSLGGSGDHGAIVPSQTGSLAGSGDHNVTGLSPGKSIPRGATLLKCTPDGRVLKTPSGSPAVFRSPIKLSSSRNSTGKVQVLPVHSETIQVSDSLTKSELSDYGKITGDVMDSSETRMELDHKDAGNAHHNYHDDGDYDPQDDSNDVSDDEPEDKKRTVRKKKNKPQKDLTPVQPVRKSLRTHSYEGVSKIVASLRRPKKKAGEKLQVIKSDQQSTEDVVSAHKVENKALSDKYFSQEFVKCNICKAVLDRKELRPHIDEKHGLKGYKCGLCGWGFDTNIDLHMHLLGHEKANRVKKTLSLFSEDMESKKHQLKDAGSSVLGGAASAAILALERGGDLQEALAVIDVDVDSMLLDDLKSRKDVKTADGNVKQTSLKKSIEECVGGRRSSPRIKANLKSKSKEAVCEDGSTTNSNNNHFSTEESGISWSGATSESGKKNAPDGQTVSIDVSTEAGDCAACRDSFMSSFQLQKQDLGQEGTKQHTCGKTIPSSGASEDVGDGGGGGVHGDDSKSEDILPCVCGLCGYRFVNVNLLTRHVKAHYQEKPFACSLCHKKYGRHDELAKHRLTHQKTVDKPKQERRKFLPRLKNGSYPCHLCQKTFKTYQNRYTHILTHENPSVVSPEKSSGPEKKEMPKKAADDKSNVTCDVCGLVLSGPRHLQRHKLVHSSERPWLCQDCGKSFLRNDDLRVHRRRRHLKENPVTMINEETDKNVFQNNCPFCKKNFTSFRSFRNHVKTHKSEKLDGSLKCNVCGKVFIKHISLRNHQQKHKDTYRRGMKRNVTAGGSVPVAIFNCEKCGKRIKNKSNFIRHMKLHNNGKDLFCNHCNKRFARSADLKMHERLHTGERPFLCNICGKGFTSNSSLSHHVKLHDQPVVYKFSCTQCDGLFSSRKEFRAHVKTCTPKTMEIVFIEDMETVPIETIQYLEQSAGNKVITVDI